MRKYSRLTRWGALAGAAAALTGAAALVSLHASVAESPSARELAIMQAMAHCPYKCLSCAHYDDIVTEPAEPEVADYVDEVLPCEWGAFCQKQACDEIDEQTTYATARERAEAIVIASAGYTSELDELLRRSPHVAVYNADRNSVQVLGCAGAVIANFPMDVAFAR